MLCKDCSGTGKTPAKQWKVTNGIFSTGGMICETCHGIGNIVTSERAEEVYEKCKQTANHGPWSDQLRKVLTPIECDYINAVWDKMPGNTSFVEAFFSIKNGN